MAVRKTFKQPQPVWVRHDDGDWRPGFLFAWERPTGGSWVAEVSYGAAGGESESRRLPAERVRVGNEHPGAPVRPGTIEPMR